MYAAISTGHLGVSVPSKPAEGWVVRFIVGKVKHERDFSHYSTYRLKMGSSCGTVSNTVHANIDVEKGTAGSLPRNNEGKHRTRTMGHQGT